ncbi:MAG: hypothetical protein Q8L48_44130 [Archangium sp.]|nr:hypothetical protein [Archangium sp.]
MNELHEEALALEAALRTSADADEVEQVLRRGELTVLRLEALAALADRLATRLRARVIAGCRERLGADSPA